MGCIVMRMIVVMMGMGRGTLMIVTMFRPMGEQFKEKLDKEAYEDGGGNLEVEVWCDETVLPITKKHVRHKVDKAGCQKEGSAKNVDIVDGLVRESFARRQKNNPYEDANDDEGV